jgi:asparagine synthase (glutamine-hydrolysing)
MMAREVAEPVPTFSIGFAEKEFDEIPHARVVSEEFGTRQFEAQADTDLIGALPIIIKGLGEPSDPVALSFFSASRLAANHVKVALGGEGGNELFAGVDRYRGLRLATYYSFVPAPIRRAIIAPLIHRIPSSFGYNSLAIKLRWLQQMAETQDMGDRLAEAVSFFRFNQAEKDTLLTENVRQFLDPGSAAREISDRYHESDAESSVERMVYTDYCTRLPEHLLMLSDRMGMVHGLEVRAPLVDKELVEYMAAFPLAMKIRRNKARYIWYKLAERVLPASIASRKKRGFKLPLAYWFAVELHPFLRQVIQDSRLAAAGVFDRTYMLQILEEHRRRQIDHSWKIWMLLNLEMWYRMEIEGVSLEQAREWVERIASDA